MSWAGQEASDELLREFFRARSPGRNRMMKNWGVIGGIAAAMAVGVYVLWGPNTGRKKRRRGMVPGLLNLGNTCFLNALLQGMATCPSLIRWLQHFTTHSITTTRLEATETDVEKTDGETETQTDTRVSQTLLRLLTALSSPDPGEVDVLDAGCLLEALRLYRWHISSFEEQDAHELFHVLTSSLEEERERQPRVAHLFDAEALEALEKSAQASDGAGVRCWSRGPLHPIPNLWRTQHPFHGRLTNCMACKRCERQSPVRYDSFDSLSLSIPAVQWGRPVTLDQCLQYFISSETIKEVECENCTKKQADTRDTQALESQRTTFVKHLKLGKLPQCLCIHLQRLTWSPEGAPIKRHEHVQFSEYLSMDRYKHGSPTRRLCKPTAGERDANVANGVDSEHHNNNKPILNGNISSVFLRPHQNDISSPEYLYRLTAVLVHHGDTHSGHFVTYRRGPAPFNQQWLWVSDESVRKASLQEVLSSCAYLLFYERVCG